VNDIFLAILVLVITCLYLDCLILESFLDKLWGLGVITLILPTANIEEVLVVTLSLTFLCLVLLTEVTTTRLVAL